MANRHLEQWGTEMMLTAEERGMRVLKNMGEVYEDATQAIQEDIDRILGAVISRNELELTLAQLRKELSKAEVKSWKKSVGEYMDEIAAMGGIEDPRGHALWMELEYLSAKTRITRLEALQMSVDANAARVAAIAEARVTEHLMDLFMDDYFRNMYSYYLMDVPEVLTMMEAGSIGVGVTNAFVLNIVKENWVGNSTFVQRLWKNEYNGAFRMMDAVSQVLVSGRAPSAVAKVIAERTELDRKELEVLIQTESAHVKNTADRYSYEAAGFDEVEYCATLDRKTCPHCGEMDGRIIKMSELMAAVNQPPLHARCRCTLLPTSKYLRDLDVPDLKRAARNMEGDRVYVDGKMTYKEWKKENLSNAQQKRVS